MLDVDLNLVIETDLHLLTVIVIQLGLVPPLCVISLTGLWTEVSPLSVSVPLIDIEQINI